MKTVITYGTFDLFHVGHVRLLERARSFGDRLIVGVSSDEFNATKGKKSFFRYEDRAAIVSSLKFVDLVFAELSWDQKESDVTRYKADVFVMGDDWAGKFDFLSPIVEVQYLPRIEDISSTHIKTSLAKLGPEQVNAFKSALDVLADIERALR